MLNSVEFSGQKVRFGQNEPTKENYGLTRDFEGHYLSKEALSMLMLSRFGLLVGTILQMP